MRFDWPHALWLLPVLACWLWQRHKQPDPALIFPSLGLLTDSGTSWRIRLVWLTEAIGALALLALVFALARPRVETATASNEIQGISIELLVDLSSSMNTPVQGSTGGLNRLAVVKDVLPRFILGDGQGLSGRENDLIGLVGFARYADTLSPQTTAHDALVEIIRDLELETRPNEDGTAYGDAVALAAARLHAAHASADRREAELNPKSRVIVLLTDGENNCGRHLPLEATALAKQWGIRIYVISLTDEVPRDGRLSRAPLPPSAAEQVLMRMAAETGGMYRQAQDNDSLAGVYSEIDRLERSEIRIQTHSEWRDYFQLFTGIGLALLIIQMVLSSTVARRVP